MDPLALFATIAGILGGIAVIVGFFRWLVGLRKPSAPKLTPKAAELLAEIEQCDISIPKGITIIRASGNEGDYLPHLHDAKPPSGVRLESLYQIIAATDELVEAGYLVFHSAENAVTEYRRTQLPVRKTALIL
jgi:hypothetical protein